MENVILW